MDLERLIDSWNTAGMSLHLKLAFRCDTASPVVPGCDCLTCLTISGGGSPQDAFEAEMAVEALSRLPPRQRTAAAAAWARERRRLRPGVVLPRPGVLAARAARVPGAVRARRVGRHTANVEQARRTSILEVARRLGLGDPHRRGREWFVRCPLHQDDNPSLRMNADKNVWYCDPCGKGGDGITLARLTMGISFREAVALLRP